MGKVLPNYHSALKPVALPSAPQQEYRGRWGRAFVWDISKGFPPTMAETADILYGEPPWRHGYEKFAERAGKGQALPFNELMGRLGRNIREIGKPAAFIASKQVIKLLSPDSVEPAILNGFECVVCLWGDTGVKPGLDTVSLLSGLAQRFSVVGDPFCGYGWSGRVFVQHNKRYVLSDFNAECIGHIAANEGQWRGA